MGPENLEPCPAQSRESSGQQKISPSENQVGPTMKMGYVDPGQDDSLELVFAVDWTIDLGRPQFSNKSCKVAESQSLYRA